jgi:hypothetical protein
MLSLIALSILVAITATALQVTWNYRKYIESARKTGLDYVLVRELTVLFVMMFSRQMLAAIDIKFILTYILAFPAVGFHWFMLQQLIAPPLRKFSFSSSWKWL